MKKPITIERTYGGWIYDVRDVWTAKGGLEAWGGLS